MSFKILQDVADEINLKTSKNFRLFLKITVTEIYERPSFKSKDNIGLHSSTYSQYCSVFSYVIAMTALYEDCGDYDMNHEKQL
jgi:hypothetical protein